MREAQPSHLGHAGTPAKRRFAASAMLLTSLLLSLAIAELGARLAGRKPWAYARLERQEPTLYQPDPVLGWTNKPGHYVLPPYVPGGNEVEVTILPDGSRATGRDAVGDGPRVVVLGCSVTFGTALSDGDTYPWKVQQSHPELHIVNFGSAAYSTLQALLRMERVVAESPPRLILYGFFSRHEPRNVATYNWLRDLMLHSRRGNVAPPYVTLTADGGVQHHPPEPFAVWPFADRLVTVRMAGDAYMHLVTYDREAQGPEATKRLLVEMTRFAREHSTPFAVLFLLAQPGKKEEYVAHFEKNHIPYVDCVEPFTDEYKIPGEGHPNGELNSIWARCLADKLPALLGTGLPAGSAMYVGSLRGFSSVPPGLSLEPQRNSTASRATDPLPPRFRLRRPEHASASPSSP